jgi:hypothetical protein
MDNRPNPDEVYDADAAALLAMTQTDGWAVFVRKGREAIERNRDALESGVSGVDAANIQRGVIQAIRMLLDLPKTEAAAARRKK